MNYKINIIRNRSDEKIIQRIALLIYMDQKNPSEAVKTELERVKQVCRDYNREHLISEGEKFYEENRNKYYI